MDESEKVVIDTNIFISAFGWGGKPLKIIELLEAREIRNCISEEIIKELVSAVSYPKLDFPQELQTNIIEFILAYSDIYETKEHLSIASDTKDNKFIECALSSKAEFIITGDKGLLSVKQYKNIKIVSPEDFLITKKYK